MRQWFIDYLAETFGEEILGTIPAPHDHEVGERVLYKLRDGVSVERKEATQKDADDFLEILKNAMSGIGEAQVTTALPVTSGLPYPRMVDILDWSVAMEIPAKKYLASDALLPKENFSILWLLGVSIGSSSKQLVYIDFTHPKVKTIFSAAYDREFDFGRRDEAFWHMHQFMAARDSLIAEADAESSMRWSKLVQIDGEMLVHKKPITT